MCRADGIIEVFQFSPLETAADDELPSVVFCRQDVCQSYTRQRRFVVLRFSSAVVRRIALELRVIEIRRIAIILAEGRLDLAVSHVACIVDAVGTEDEFVFDVACPDFTADANFFRIGLVDMIIVLISHGRLAALIDELEGVIQVIHSRIAQADGSEGRPILVEVVFTVEDTVFFNDCPISTGGAKFRMDISFRHVRNIFQEI